MAVYIRQVKDLIIAQSHEAMYLTQQSLSVTEGLKDAQRITDLQSTLVYDVSEGLSKQWQYQSACAHQEEAEGGRQKQPCLSLDPFISGQTLEGAARGGGVFLQFILLEKIVTHPDVDSQD